MNRKILRVLALVLVVSAVAVWLVTGTSRGWTKTRVWLKAGEGREDFWRIKCTNIAICGISVGMKHETTGGQAFNPAEKQFIHRLRQQPKLWERFQSILALTGHAEGPLRTADEMEVLLIQELRALGHTSMNDFATQAEARVGDELKGRDATVRSRKKNADVVVCLWVGKRARSDLAQPKPELSASLA